MSFNYDTGFWSMLLRPGSTGIKIQQTLHQQQASEMYNITQHEKVIVNPKLCQCKMHWLSDRKKNPYVLECLMLFNSLAPGNIIWH